jgi:hypothetical protein
MKIFNVSLQVRITQIAQIPDNPTDPEPRAKEPFNDDPMDKQEKILNKYLDRVAAIQTPHAAIPSEAESAMLTRSIRVQAETFEDLQAILQKFNAVTKEIPTVDESLLKVATPIVPSSTWG